MGRVITPLEQFGARFEAAEGGRLPLTLHGARNPVPITYTLPVASAQVKSAVLLAGLNTPGRTTVIEPVADARSYRAHAQGLRRQAIDRSRGRRPPHHRSRASTSCKAQDIDVPGDPSSAAFPHGGGADHRRLGHRHRKLMLNPTRTGLDRDAARNGRRHRIENRRLAGGEEVGDLHVKSSRLHGVRVPAARAPSMIDEYPILAVAASFAEGTTRMEGLEELRVKESDRLAAVEAGLQANGVMTHSGRDWLEVIGRRRARRRQGHHPHGSPHRHVVPGHGAGLAHLHHHR